ncbi:hypothetical protein NDU88_001691 [Pleurodeles waltl]|uniref:Uncharacterized protein n=1 Tax=Pleurodeles waltl TaxID=8319 RepID=A0AAV7LYC8_PLEWA|nr:hypothetical protein NDU88_001691 [Pleurodeles waltl]
MGVWARGAHARLSTLAQARSPVERGVEPKLSDAEESTLGGASNMAAPCVFSQLTSASGKSKVGTSAKGVPGSQVTKEIVIISNEDEDLQESIEGGLVKDSRGGADDAQPSTSQGAGVGWASMEEELLDYEEDLEEPATSQKRVVMARAGPGVVQGGHAKAHIQDVSAGNLPRGAVRRSGGFDVISRRQDDAVRFVMQQIEAGLPAVTISACSQPIVFRKQEGPVYMCLRSIPSLAKVGAINRVGRFGLGHPDEQYVNIFTDGF